MSTTLAHPFRITGAGTVATLAQGSPSHAAQLAGHVLSTGIGERGLAPRFGLPDPTGTPLDTAVISGALSACAPDLDVDTVTIGTPAGGHVDVTITVDWSEEA